MHNMNRSFIKCIVFINLDEFDLLFYISKRRMRMIVSYTTGSLHTHHVVSTIFNNIYWKRIKMIVYVVVYQYYYGIARRCKCLKTKR